MILIINQISIMFKHTKQFLVVWFLVIPGYNSWKRKPLRLAHQTWLIKRTIYKTVINICISLYTCVKLSYVNISPLCIVPLKCINASIVFSTADLRNGLSIDVATNHYWNTNRHSPLDCVELISVNVDSSVRWCCLLQESIPVQVNAYQIRHQSRFQEYK